MTSGEWRHKTSLTTPWQQISEFKRKFGGVEVQLVPTLDHVYDATAYDRFQSVERNVATKVSRTTSAASAHHGRPAAAATSLADISLSDQEISPGQLGALRRA